MKKISMFSIFLLCFIVGCQPLHQNSTDSSITTSSTLENSGENTQENVDNISTENSLNSPVTQYSQRPNTEDDCLLGQYVFSDDIVDMFFRFIDDNHDELPSWIDQRTGFAFFYINNGEEIGYEPTGTVLIEFKENGTFTMFAEEFSQQYQITHRDADGNEYYEPVKQTINGLESADYIIENGKLIFFDIKNDMQYQFEIDGKTFTEQYDLLDFITDSEYNCDDQVVQLNTSLDSENTLVKNNGFGYFSLWKLIP